MVNKFVDHLTSLNTSVESANEENKNAQGEVTVHHVPFKLDYDGHANVDLKFTQKIKLLSSEDPTVLRNQFRGRPLLGQKIDLPKNYEGLIASDLKKTFSDLDGESTQEISIVKRFDLMTYWNWDKIPSEMDKHQKLMDWIGLSQILHEPIES